MVGLLARAAPSHALTRFVEEVGGPGAGPVTVRGNGGHWHLGGALEQGVRVVGAPAGIVQFDPAEMMLRCGAGTTIGEITNALDASRQCCPFDPVDANSTVGGLLAAGLSGHRRLRFGAVRDLLLETQFVSAPGDLLRAGAPVVKNVSGYDLCRLLVGSFGTLGLLGEVVLRCRPRPSESQWYFFANADPNIIRALIFQPSSVLWDGKGVWLLNEGYASDLRAEEQLIRSADGISVANGPSLPQQGRLSVDPATIKLNHSEWDRQGSWVAEIGVGTVHTSWMVPRRSAPHHLERKIKANLDPTRRFSPGRLEL
jgi:FAD/FMN-containing dehydrogenase